MEVHLEKQKEVGFVCHGHIKRVSMKHVPVRGANNAITQGKKHKVNIEGSKIKREDDFTATQIKNQFKDQEVISNVEHFVRKHLEGQSKAKITKMYEHKGQFLVSTTSHYCENKKCNHNSNHVWFLIANNTIMQKCFSNTDIMRHFGFCKDFTGRRHQLPSKITDKLKNEGDNDGKINKYVTKKTKKEEENKNPEDVKDILSKFIQKHVIKNETVTISKIEKGKKPNIYMVNTSYSCKKCNNTNTFFQITKNKIQQKCNCISRVHDLTDKIITKL